jgi:N-acetylglutamate synthase-like GNAT family acetyltransferase
MAKLNAPQSAIKKIYVLSQQINFGDKTGFSTTGGLPAPNLKGQNC